MELGKELKTEIVKDGDHAVLNLTGSSGKEGTITLPMMKEFLSRTEGDMVLMLSIKDTGFSLKTSGGAQSIEGGTTPAIVRRMIQALEENAAVLRESLVKLEAYNG